MGKPSGTEGLRVLILEPYHGGSHKSFLAGLSRLPFNFESMTLPARKWKWRMRLSAPYYAGMLHRSGQRFDRILCSTFVDVAAFRGLAPEWVRRAPVLTYFHENQFDYPMRVDDERDFHFALTNVTTALASDRLAFNSEYNLTSFLDGIDTLIKKSYDLKLDMPCEGIRAKSNVIPAGIDFAVIDRENEQKREKSPVILWNHRWEHDKNPEMFFKSLFKLHGRGVDFRLIVLGESFRESPRIFSEARKRLSGKILHFGYVTSRREYARLLKKADIVVSTARHEFFGIAVIEAVRAGCRPLLPGRLSYPELFPGEYLYDEEVFYDRLRQEILKNRRLTADRAAALTEPYSWDTLAHEYISWIKSATVPKNHSAIEQK